MNSWILRRWSPSWSVGFTFLLSIAAYLQVDRMETEDLSDELRILVQADAGQIEQALHEAALYTTMTRQLFDASGSISREEFCSFVGGFPSLDGLQGISWNPLVDASERTVFEAEVREEYPAARGIRQRIEGQMTYALGRDEYCPVQFIWPLVGNEFALGYDVLSEPTRREAALRARDDGELTMTAPVTLVQESTKSSAVLMFAPLYADGLAPATVSERREHFEGYCVSVMRMEPILERAIDEIHRAPQGVNLVVRDITTASDVGVLHVYASRVITAPWSLSRLTSNATQRGEFVVGGRTIEVLGTATDHFVSLHATGRLETLLLTLLAINALVITFARRSVIHARVLHTQAQQLLGSETAQRRAAQRANEAKSELLANISHEMRTPMNGVIGLLDVLMHSGLKPKQLATANTIRNSAQSLLAILSEILSFSKIEAGKLELTFQPMCLEDVVLTPCALLDSVARTNNVICTIFVDPKFPRELYGDSARLQQIIVNLLGNAIKFSGGRQRKGVVSLRAIMVDAEDGAAPVWLELSVRDDGVGMDAQTQARLFQPFEQATSITSQRFGGTGLGLAISQQLARLMGGEISVVSTLHQGSLFTLRVPLARVASANSAGALDARHDQQILEGLDCCVIGRPTVLTEDVAEYLRDAGATVRFATATSARLDVEPSCWITDVEEPRSLEQVRDALRESCAAELCTNDGAPNSPSAKLFVLTRGRRRTPRFLAPDVVELDADMATRASIVQAVAELTGRAVRNETDPNSASVTHDSNEFPAVVRADELKHGRLILVAEDDATNQEVMRQQLAMLGYAADIVDNGLVALELWRTGDYALVLADIQMSLMDGHELMQAIRREETHAGAKRTPIIAVTANAMDAEHIRCTASGADDFLTKPVLMDELKTKLTRWLPATGDHVREVIERMRPHATRPTLVRDNTAGVDAPIDAVISAPIDLTLLTQTFVSAPHVLAELMSKFAQRGVSNAAEIESAVSEDRLDQARTLAHKLKGASGNFGARQLMNLCAALEYCDAATNQVKMRAMALQITAEMDRVNAHLITHPLPHRAPE